ncbi:MAG: ATP-grasp domain-containing protein [Patescibacteria group bacterium]|jgi:D-alanine-D-alanine ligase
MSININRKNDNHSLEGKTILLVNTGASSSTGSEHKRFIIKRIGELGVQVVAVNEKANIKAKCVTNWILADLSDHQLVIKKIEEFIHNHPDIKIDGVVTFYEDAVLLVSKIVDRFHFKGTPYRIADVVRNKYKFRNFCSSHQLPAPNFVKISKISDLEIARNTLRFPIVLKPSYGASSAFVLKVDEANELIDVYNYIKKNISQKIESALDNNLVLIAEEYIDGDEVDINLLVQNGRIKFYNITDNYKTYEPYFIETGMAEPSALPEDKQRALINMVEEVLDILHIQDACIQFEAKSSPRGPVPLEINLRMGGDEAYYFVKAAWGVDLIAGAIKIAVNQHFTKIDKPENPYKYLSGMTLHASYSGVVSKIEYDEKTNSKYVQNVELLKNVGDTILVPPFGYEYMGWVSAMGDNPVHATDNLNTLLKSIKYTIAKFDEASFVGRTTRKQRHQGAVLAGRKITGSEKIKKIRSIELKDQRKLHVGIACNDYLSDKNSNTVEKDLSQVGISIQTTLKRLGYKTSYFDFNDPQKAIGDLSKSGVDLVFNVCERINDTSLLEPHAASIFDILQIPYTGSSPFTLGLCIDKIKVKKLLNYHNLPTPAWDYAYDVDDEIDSSLKYPLIVKPANTDNSIGITNDSVVTNKQDLLKMINYVVKKLGSPALIEEYIDGDEYNVFIMGNDEDSFKVLPLSRTIFSNLPKNYWHIKTLNAKFGLDDVYKKNIIFQQPPKSVSSKLISLLTEISLDTYNILDCHDYGRIEVKVDKNNNPYILELNPNPSIDIVDVTDINKEGYQDKYGRFLEDIIRLTISRYKNNPPYYHLQSNII